jgi:carboxyl-terminal processing protease
MCKATLTLLLSACLLGVLIRPARPADDFVESVLDATRLLSEQHVKPVSQGQLVDWAITGLYLRLGESVSPDIAARWRDTANMSEAELRGLLLAVRESFGPRPELDSLQDIDIALQGVFSRLEPNTTQTPQQVARNKPWRCILRLWVPTGIGVRLRYDPVRRLPEVVTPLKDGPAFRARIQAGDRIRTILYEVDNDNKPLAEPEVFRCGPPPLMDPESVLLGKPDIPVKVVIERPGVERLIEVEVVRGKVEEETLFGWRSLPDGSRDLLIDRRAKLAYVRIPRFGRSTARELGKELAVLDKQGIQGLVLDLRFCEGGLLDIVNGVAGLLTEGEPTMSIRARTGKVYSVTGGGDGSFLRFPVVCLINGATRSGGEMVAACLQDYKRALILGERSAGDACIHNLMDLRDGELWFATALFVRPSGKYLDRMMASGSDEEDWGVVPDAGFDIHLSRGERIRLQEHLARQEIIPPLTGLRDAPTPFKDRQLRVALDYLEEQLKPARLAK